MDMNEGERVRSGRMPFCPTGILAPFLLLILFSLFCAGCAYHRPLYVYRAYQDPQTARGAYYLHEAFVVAPNHATAMDIVTRTMSEMHPGSSGPFYVSLIGVSEEKRQPGLLGSAIWAETTGRTAPEKRTTPPTAGQ